MAVYSEEDYLQLSGIQHFTFCRRQWALIHVEQLWEDNLRTVEGEILHKRAHDAEFVEKRKNVIITRGMPVFSREMGVSGKCDIVEFIQDKKNGVELHGREGRYRIEPVEYKRGKPKTGEEDILQLAAEAMCLEEMLCCTIEKGYLYYGETRHRTEVCITEELRENVREMFLEMHQYAERNYTPKARMKKSCNACSLKDLCLPRQFKKKSVEEYILSKIGGTEDEKDA